MSKETVFEKFYRLVARTAQSFKRCFNTPDGRAVLIDLAPFCCASAPAYTEREQGRRDVWLRITQYLHMPEEELAALFAKLSPEQRFQLWNPNSGTYLEE